MCNSGRTVWFALVACVLVGFAPGCDEGSDEPGPEGPPPDEGRGVVITPGGRPSFCVEVRCPAGTVCNEAADVCESTPSPTDFCASVDCPIGTLCNEQTDSCDPLVVMPGSPSADFCASAPCPPGTVCNEVTDSCEQSTLPNDFCANVTCPPGTVCNEQSDACEVL